MRKKIPLWLKIIIGMILGVIWGLIAVNFGLEKLTSDWIKPWGTIFIKLLKLIAVPLIFISLVKGVTSITDISKLSRIGIKTISLYLVSTVISIVIGLLLVNALNPGATFPEQKRKELQAQYEQTVKEKEIQAAEVKDQSPLHIVEEMVPDNIFLAMSNNTRMLQVIFFSILFAISMILLESSKVLAVKNLFDSLNDIVLKIVDIIMKFAPIGVFALLASLVTDFSGDADLFLALGKYALLVCLGLVGLILFLYPPFILLFTKIKLKTFFKALFPVQMVALLQ